jgi:CheY-like chemotaxis protein
MQMPDMDGEETAARITQSANLSKIPIILYTSIGDCGTSEQAREKGFAAVLTKPAKQSQFFNVMLTVLGNSELTRGLPEKEIAEVKVSLGLNVLLAEDNEINQMVAQMMLDRFGCHTTTVENGRLAVKAFHEFDFDLILMDIHMPEMDGYEATGEIRDREKTLPMRTPIIAMTAKAMPGDREAGLAAGMDDYIVKPVRPEELYQVLNRWGMTKRKAKIRTRQSKAS